MTALYKIAHDYQAIFTQFLDEDEGALLKLNDVKDLLENKVIAIASYIKNLDAECNAVKEAKKEMAERESKLARKTEQLNNYLIENMEISGITEISRSPYFCIKLKKCPVSVEIHHEEDIPDEYLKVKKVYSIDKVKIREEIQAGVIVPGATLKQNLRLEIK